MKILYVAINAKYIHTNNAVRLLYQSSKDYYFSEFKEFTIKDNIERIVGELLSYDIIGFSCYIWNIELIKELTVLLRQINDKILTIAGGPEVSYDPLPFRDYFDYIVSGEGENVIVPLLDYISGKIIAIPKCVTSKSQIYSEVNYIEDLSSIPDITDLFSEDDLKNRYIYLEFSRGCPFKCSYCLSQFDCKLRLFNDQQIEQQFLFLNTHNLFCVKFLDRSFNVDGEKFIELTKRLAETNGHYQFEIEANILSPKIVDYLVDEIKPNTFRLEIGIQTLNEESLKAVDRHQENKRLIQKINQINKGQRVEIHLDLIAGLPYDTILTFKDTFNQIFCLQCPELQLGFLKMLRGTKIRLEASKYNYQFDKMPPYEFIANQFISIEDKQKLLNVQRGLNWLWNDKRAKKALEKLLIDNIDYDFFSLFEKFGEKYDKLLPLEDNYRLAASILPDYIDDLKYDYLLKNRIRIKRWWPNFENKESLIKLVHQKYPNYSISSLTNSFITAYYQQFIVILYQSDHEFLLL